jgi:uncharacterized protein
MLRIYIKYIVYLYVLIQFSFASAGSYEDYFSAIRNDDAATVQSLLRRGFDANTRDPNKQHGLYLALREPSFKAALKGHTELVTALLNKDADVNKTGWAPLHYAATSGNVALIGALLEKHAYIDAESPNGTTPLMMAAMYGTPSAVKLLLEEGADPLLKNQIGMTAIVRARQPAGKW